MNLVTFNDSMQPEQSDISFGMQWLDAGLLLLHFAGQGLDSILLTSFITCIHGDLC